MVTVSVLESSSGESAQRIAFILSFLLDKERTVKDFRFPKLQCTAVLSYQITRNNLLVEQVPTILVTERTDTLLKELPGSIIITAGLHFPDVLHSSQHLAATLVIGVVIHVAHNYHLCLRIIGMQRVGYMAGDTGCKLAQR